METENSGAKGQEPAMLLDIRDISRDKEELAVAMVKYWPCVPGRDPTGEEAAVDCMAILARINLTRTGSSSITRPHTGEDAFVRYIWLLFDDNTWHYGEIMDSARNKAVSLFRRELGPGFTFEALCRSKTVVNTIWKLPLNQLTYPEIMQGPDHPQGKIVCTGAEMATKGFLEWDGTGCSSLAELASKVTRQAQLEDGNTLFVYFRAPSLLEVRFTPGPGCEQSLKDLFQFSTDFWARHKIDENVCQIRQEGKQAYMLMAVVKHRKTPEDGDCIRVFFQDGWERLPTLA